jgi:hypothetical protein
MLSGLQATAQKTIEWVKDAPSSSIDSAIAAVEGTKEFGNRLQNNVVEAKAQVLQIKENIGKEIDKFKDRASDTARKIAEPVNQASRMYHGFVQARIAKLAAQAVTKGEYRANLTQIKTPKITYKVGDFKVQTTVENGNKVYTLANKQGKPLSSFTLDDRNRPTNIRQHKGFDVVAFNKAAREALSDRGVVATTNTTFERNHKISSNMLATLGRQAVAADEKAQSSLTDNGKGSVAKGSFTYTLDKASDRLTVTDRASGKILLTQDSEGTRSNLPPDKVEKLVKMVAATVAKNQESTKETAQVTR